MKVLMLAPHPFYQDRGTPIAVHMLLKVLSDRGDEIDLLTYHEGRDMQYPGVCIHRIRSLPLIHNIRPGFSWKKILCDGLLFLKSIKLASQKRYALVHAVEESVFIALMLKWFFKIPYVYDVDSSLPQQLVERYRVLTLCSFILNFFEKIVVKNALAVAVVCEALSASIQKDHPQKVIVLQDMPLLKEKISPDSCLLKEEFKASGPILMYVGNLEFYQGIDLLLESFALVLKETRDVDLVVVGGEDADILKYRKVALHLHIQEKVHFLGPKPVECLGDYLAQADILVSPRLKGRNTPMKLYSYLASGKPTLATDLETHTQVLDREIAELASPSLDAFSKGMLRLIRDSSLREQLGVAGKSRVDEKYSYKAFQKKLNDLYGELEAKFQS